LKQPQIAKAEAGTVGQAADDLIPRLAEVLNFPEEFFKLSEHRIGFGSSALYYRKKARLTATDRKRIHSIVNVARIGIKGLLDSVELDPIRRLPRILIDDTEKSAQEIACEVRAYWSLPDGPIKNVTALLEGAGVLVFPCDFGTSDMDATAIWLNDMPPTIFINQDLPGDRWRFTLCHELAHLVMHDVPRETMEDEADQFAAEFLMPEVDMRPEFMKRKFLSFNDLISLKSYWKVAISALIRRGKDLGYLSADKAKRLYIERSRHGGNAEPAQFPRESVKNLDNVIRYFKEKMEFSVTDFSVSLKISDRELKSLFGISDEEQRPRGHLRLV